jgi:hypothetical protein
VPVHTRKNQLQNLEYSERKNEMIYLVCPKCGSDALDYARDCSFDGMQHFGWQLWCENCKHTWQGDEGEMEQPNIKPCIEMRKEAEAQKQEDLDDYWVMVKEGIGASNTR